MPNLLPPLTSVAQIEAYQAQIKSLSPAGFTPYFSLYLTDALQGDVFQQAKANPAILGAKLYPAGATTNSKAGVTAINALYPLFEAMQELNLVLQIHGETTSDDIFDREAKFLDTQLAPIVKNFPKLNIVLEHISTAAACEFVSDAPANVAATITIHHLLYNRNDLLAGGIKPHFYCLPILKRRQDQQALQAAALSGNPKFFLGTDSAPHAISDKESHCGCAGIFSARYAIELYAEFFDAHQALAKLPPFASRFGADFYQLPYNKTEIELVRQPQTIPQQLPLGNKLVQPIAAGQTINWQLTKD